MSKSRLDKFLEWSAVVAVAGVAWGLPIYLVLEAVVSGGVAGAALFVSGAAAGAFVASDWAP